jgi:hypothetical protein
VDAFSPWKAKMNKIDKEHLTNVCKLGCGKKEVCRYLGLTGDGWCCMKLTKMRAMIDAQKEAMAAQGNNCDGIGEIETIVIRVSRQEREEELSKKGKTWN